MLEEREIEGEWWLPETPDRKLHGTLVFAAERFELHVKGQLPTPPEGIDGEVYPTNFDRVAIPVVFGMSEDNKEITLFNVSGFSLLLPESVKTRETWRPGVALVGAHVFDDATFRSMFVRVENLDEWAVALGVGFAIEPDSDGVPATYNVSASRSILAEAAIEGVGRVELRTRPQLSQGARTATLTVRSSFHVVFDSALPWGDAWRAATVLRDLVRLATGKPCACEELGLFFDDGRNAAEASAIQVLMRTTALLRSQASPVDGHDMIFRRSSMPGGFESCMQLWRPIRQRFRRGWKLLVDSDDAKLVDPYEQFVSYARAIESMHALDFGRSPGANDERDQRVERAIASIDDDLKEWARPLLEVSTPPVQRHRLCEIVAAIGPVGSELVGGDVSTFARSVVATRNDLIHLPEQTRRHVLESSDEIYWYGRALYWIAIAYLLLKLGMEEDQIAQRLARPAAAGTVIEEMRVLTTVPTASGEVPSDL